MLDHHIKQTRAKQGRHQHIKGKVDNPLRLQALPGGQPRGEEDAHDKSSRDEQTVSEDLDEAEFEEYGVHRLTSLAQELAGSTGGPAGGLAPPWG